MGAHLIYGSGLEGAPMTADPRERDPTSDEETADNRLDEALDEALEETFPASDPPAVTRHPPEG